MNTITYPNQEHNELVDAFKLCLERCHNGRDLCDLDEVFGEIEWKFIEFVQGTMREASDQCLEETEDTDMSIAYKIAARTELQRRASEKETERRAAQE